MHSSKHTHMLWLWWRRQSFYLRRISVMKIIFLLLCIIFLLRKLPNPFSSQYSRISINQNVQWDSISGILAMKKNILLNDPLSSRVKVTKEGTEEPQPSSSSILILL
ncbi:unnamed protein product, partial [Rotaria magnacalcarata]